jgi:glycosyltransferase involved in cell wall biosynthesis
MNIALCYESVLPARGGAETYIGDLARRLAADGHQVHLYACRWDAASLPASTVFHALEVPNGPRFLRPWRFGKAVEKALAANTHDVTVGFDKTWGQDVLYPQGTRRARRTTAASSPTRWCRRWRRPPSGSTSRRGRSAASNASSTWGGRSPPSW